MVCVALNPQYVVDGLILSVIQFVYPVSKFQGLHKICSMQDSLLIIVWEKHPATVYSSMDAKRSFGAY